MVSAVGFWIQSTRFRKAKLRHMERHGHVIGIVWGRKADPR
jgi:hypothetical protein